MQLSVVIPTLDRGSLVLATIEQLCRQSCPASEIIVVDQTRQHPCAIAHRLQSLHDAGTIQLVRRDVASIPGAMNAGVAAARGELVLFLDDDVTLHDDLIAQHVARHRADDVAIVAGRVLQPWHDALAIHEASSALNGATTADRFPFHADVACDVTRFSGGNVSMRRSWIVRLGGFDENFVGAAYRFEADFAARAHAAGGRIVFEPQACIDHLHHADGGTRSHGDHLHTARPWHSAGRWYYLMCHPQTPGLLALTVGEARRSVLARSHLRRPWRILPSLIAELGGIGCAAMLRLRGPRRVLNSEGPR